MNKQLVVSLAKYQITTCLVCLHIRFCMDVGDNEIDNKIHLCSDCLQALAEITNQKEKDSFLFTKENIKL